MSRRDDVGKRVFVRVDAVDIFKVVIECRDLVVVILVISSDVLLHRNIAMSGLGNVPMSVDLGLQESELDAHHPVTKPYAAGLVEEVIVLGEEYRRAVVGSFNFKGSTVDCRGNNVRQFFRGGDRALNAGPILDRNCRRIDLTIGDFQVDKFEVYFDTVSVANDERRTVDQGIPVFAGHANYSYL